MSSVEIIVPPGLAVETDGSAVMGTFDDISRAPRHPDPEAPLLRIHGLAFMGSVRSRWRLAGESERRIIAGANRSPSPGDPAGARPSALDAHGRPSTD